MQKKTLAIWFLLTTATLAACAQKAAEWVRYTSAEGRYSVLLPEQPTLSTQQSATASGTKFPQYLALTSDSDSQYIVAYFDGTANTVAFSFDGGRDGMLKGVNGTLLSETPISLEGSEGRELKISAKDGTGDEVLITARFYVVERRVYALQHASKKSDSSAASERSTRFFDSFKVTTGN